MKEKIKVLLNKCNHKEQIEFALYCAMDVDKYSNYNKEDKVNCITAVKAWLAEPTEATREACRAAANKAREASVADAASYAAASAVNSEVYVIHALECGIHTAMCQKNEFNKLKEYYKFLYDKLYEIR